MTRLDQLSARGRDFLGSTHAIMAGAMTWVSERHLVSAISNAGGFGVIACGSMPPAVLDAEIAATRALTDRPFGVNLITLHPAMDDLIDICGRHGVGHVVLAGGLPSGAAIARIKGTGAKLMCFAPTAALAKKLVRSGVDAIVIEGSEAGGHIGPVSTSVLAQEILPAITEVPVFVAGGIGRGGGDRRLSRDGRERRPARHALRRRDRVGRPCQFQARLRPRLGARRGRQRPARPAPAGDPGPRAEERRQRGLRRQAARGRRAGRRRGA